MSESNLLKGIKAIREAFDLNEEQRLFRDLVHDFVAKELKPRARETDEKAEPGSGFDIEIVLSGRYSQMILGSMTGKVVRTDDHGLAITFDQRFEWFAMVPLYFNTATDHSD